MGHTVAYRCYLVHAVNNMTFSLHHLVQDHIKGVLVGKEVGFLLHFIAIHGLVAVLAVYAYALANALAQDRLVFHADQLIFQGRAACVDHQNIHPCIISFCVISHQAPLGLDTFLSILYYWNQRSLSMTCANIYDFFAILSYHICYNQQMPPIAFLLLCVICLPRVFPAFPARSAQISRPASNSPQKPEPQPVPASPFLPLPKPAKNPEYGPQGSPPAAGLAGRSPAHGGCAAGPAGLFAPHSSPVRRESSFPALKHLKVPAP